MDAAAATQEPDSDGELLETALFPTINSPLLGRGLERWD